MTLPAVYTSGHVAMLDKLIPRKRLAEMLGKSEITLVRWEKDGKGPPVTRIGRDVVYSIVSIEKWLRAQEHITQTSC
jgi:predicted DNA-binding transcriptional regulator AlpA